MKALKLHIIALLVSLAFTAGDRTSTLKDYANASQSVFLLAEIVEVLKRKEREER